MKTVELLEHRSLDFGDVHGAGHSNSKRGPFQLVPFRSNEPFLLIVHRRKEDEIGTVVDRLLQPFYIWSLLGELAHNIVHEKEFGVIIPFEEELNLPGTQGIVTKKNSNT